MILSLLAEVLLSLSLKISILLTITIILLVSRTEGLAGSTCSETSRRSWMQRAMALSLGIQQPNAAKAVQDELPLALRDFTKLAPLGPPASDSAGKLHLSLDDLAERLMTCLSKGVNGRGGYFISGDIDEQIFRDDCIFVDPTNRVKSLSQYKRALDILFDPETSSVQVLGPLQVDTSKRQISATIRSRGYLKLPWRPYITAYESHIVYSVDQDGLVYQQEQNWSKSASTALGQSFTPSLFSPPPKSSLSKPDNEPLEVTGLFEMLNGRRPNEYDSQERMEIDSLVQSIASKKGDPSSSLLGTWVLVYLQPGPTGATIDRRIPFFPDFDFNDNFQRFGPSSVENIGQVFGPLLQVQVSGSLQQLQQPTDQYRAIIDSGKICWKESSCIGLPISGEGLFTSVYVGERLRIGQNLNGGGARVVQIRLPD